MSNHSISYQTADNFAVLRLEGMNVKVSNGPNVEGSPQKMVFLTTVPVLWDLLRNHLLFHVGETRHEVVRRQKEALAAADMVLKDVAD